MQILFRDHQGKAILVPACRGDVKLFTRASKIVHYPQQTSNVSGLDQKHLFFASHADYGPWQSWSQLSNDRTVEGRIITRESARRGPSINRDPFFLGELNRLSVQKFRPGFGQLLGFLIGENNDPLGS